MHSVCRPHGSSARFSVVSPQRAPKAHIAGIGMQTHRMFSPNLSRPGPATSTPKIEQRLMPMYTNDMRSGAYSGAAANFSVHWPSRMMSVQEMLTLMMRNAMQSAMGGRGSMSSIRMAPVLRAAVITIHGARRYPNMADPSVMMLNSGLSAHASPVTEKYACCVWSEARPRYMTFSLTSIPPPPPPPTKPFSRCSPSRSITRNLGE
mmetsp:Transcript_10483/g.18536  ORF Transcript_10483/g.18536 Transcript_10483/m.18536 type:complete len:206 (-) Transcript_10483:244-861(-)